MNVTQSVSASTVVTLPTVPSLRADLARLGVVLVVIAALLAGTVWLGQRSDVLTNLGRSLYAFLGF